MFGLGLFAMKFAAVALAVRDSRRVFDKLIRTSALRMVEPIFESLWDFKLRQVGIAPEVKRLFH